MILLMYWKSIGVPLWHFSIADCVGFGLEFILQWGSAVESLFLSPLQTSHRRVLSIKTKVSEVLLCHSESLPQASHRGSPSCLVTVSLRTAWCGIESAVLTHHGLLKPERDELSSVIESNFCLGKRLFLHFCILVCRIHKFHCWRQRGDLTS